MRESVRWIFDDHKHYNGKYWLVLFQTIFTLGNIHRLYVSTLHIVNLTMCFVPVHGMWVQVIYATSKSAHEPPHVMSCSFYSSPAGWREFRPQVMKKPLNGKNWYKWMSVYIPTEQLMEPYASKKNFCGHATAILEFACWQLILFTLTDRERFTFDHLDVVVGLGKM